MIETFLPRYTIGVVLKSQKDSAELCFVDHMLHSAQWWTLPPLREPIDFNRTISGEVDLVHSYGLEGFYAFLENHLTIDADLGVLVESDQILYFSDKGNTPAGKFEPTSPQMLILLMIWRHFDRLNFGVYSGEHGESPWTIYFDTANPYAPQPRFLSSDELTACTMQITSRWNDSNAKSLVAALVARQPGGYSFWSDAADTPSLRDVIKYLRSRQRKMLVITPNSDFSMTIRPYNGELDEVSTSFALSFAKYSGLCERAKYKGAFINLCRDFNFELRCYAKRVDILGRDPRKVWPWPEEDNWALRILNSIEKDPNSFVDQLTDQSK